MIEAVGLKEEEDSPFFIENKRVCAFWDHLITQKGGTSQGKFTAWALLLTGSFKSNYEWKIKLKKSTSDSANSYVFKQTLFIANNVHFQSSDFTIRKATWLDKLRSLYNPNKFKLSPKSKYLLLGTPIDQNIRSLIKNLQEPIEDTSLVLLQYSSKTKQLTLEIRDLLTEPELINKILSFG